MIHEDERRTLEDFPEGKLITARKGCILGNHYHRIKTECFFLVFGRVVMTTDEGSVEMKHGWKYEIYPTVTHSFEMLEDSQIIGLCSHPYDPTDDYK